MSDKKTPKEKKTKVVVLKSMFGKFRMPYDKGQEVEFETKFAKEIIAAGYATSMDDAKASNDVEGTEEKK